MVLSLYCGGRGIPSDSALDARIEQRGFPQLTVKRAKNKGNYSGFDR
jgi:hypothetical protein